MAVPKYKVSKSRAASRRSANMKLASPTLTVCNKCGNLILPHRVCPKCGYYKGEQIIKVAEK